MPNDEYFEAQDAQRALEWTRVFLRYPPVFLGVNGMLMTQKNLEAQRPMGNPRWKREAAALEAFGFTPAIYDLVRRRLELLDARTRSSKAVRARIFEPVSQAQDGLPRRLALMEWRGFVFAIEAGMSVVGAVDTLWFSGAEELARRTATTRLRMAGIQAQLYAGTRAQLIQDGRIKRITKKQIERERQEQFEESFWLAMTSQMQDNYARAKKAKGRKGTSASR